jgi:protoporphyrinogen oxidase
LSKLGITRMIKVAFSYVASRVSQIKPEKSLEDFLINRFGQQLYLTFFKSYTEKVWGTACNEIPAEWGAQRIKGLSLTSALKHFLKKSFGRSEEAIAQKGTDTSLIEHFLYPKLGAGQLWEHVAERVVDAGGEIHLGWKAMHVHTDGNRVVSVDAVSDAGEMRNFVADYFLSTMPIRELVNAMEATGTALYYDRHPDRQALGDGTRWRTAEGHVDLYPGTGGADWTFADLQQLEPLPC